MAEETKDWKGIIKRAIWRAVRVIVGLLIAGIIYKYGDQQWYVILVGPALNSISKFIRDTFGVDLTLI